MKARFAFAIVLEFFLVITLSPANAAVLKGPYLIYDGLNNTQMTVFWQLDNNQDCTIEWGPTLSYGSSDITTEYGDHQHAYTISGLTPGAKYYYQVDGVGSGSFLAAPAYNASSVKFLAYGDTRTYPADQDDVCAQMINTYTIDPGFQTICLHVGDWVSNGNDEGNWDIQFFDPIHFNINQFQSEVALNGCVGNHEFSGGTLFDKYFPYPYATGSNFYWSFEYGPAHIAIVDQYTADYNPGSAQYVWLENELANTTKEWKFIVLHEPGWSAGGHDNNLDVQTYIQPLCLAYGVDVIFAGHNHYYTRCDVAGVQHITTGGGGAPVYAANPSYPYVVATESSLHFCEIDIQGEQLFFTARRTDGSVIDTFDITHSDPEPTENLAIADLPVKGTIDGDYVGTHENDGYYEEITEEQSGGGKPKNLRSSLEHKWIFEVTGVGNTITFGINAYCTDAGESDEFIFSYSTDDSTYTEMLWINGTTDDNTYLTYTLPSSISGTVYIRVQDADQTRGNGTLDSIIVDDMYIYESMDVTPREVYVYDISMDSKVAGPNRTGIVTIWIKDTNGTNVEGATVYGDWSGDIGGTASGVTGLDGKVTIQSAKVRNGGTFTFTVSDVEASGYTYNLSLNIETSDSIDVP